MPQPLLLYPEDLIKLLVAFFLGSLLGFEREFHHKFAGLRTIILICVGACLFTIFSYRLAGDKDPTRIAAAVVTGVGFIGAGVIIHEGGEVRGLTTASTIWLAAALGIGAGGGYLLFSRRCWLLVLVCASASHERFGDRTTATTARTRRARMCRISSSAPA
jgi:putative Mg2+ transporter-C (MgtC) family protein